MASSVRSRHEAYCLAYAHSREGIAASSLQDSDHELTAGMTSEHSSSRQQHMEQARAATLAAGAAAHHLDRQLQEASLIASCGYDLDGYGAGWVAVHLPQRRMSRETSKLAQQAERDVPSVNLSSV